MKRKIGAITVGQSPRDDVIPEMVPFLGDDVEVIQVGALDGMEYDEILELKPIKGDYVLVSKLRDGRSVKFAEKHILPRLQSCIDTLEKRGVDSILFICTGTFPDVFHSDLPLLYPQKILHSVIPHMTKSGKIGVIIPAKEQIQQTVQKWGEAGLDATVAAYSPYDMSDEISQTVQEFHEKKLDLIVMDCIGYTSWMKNEVARKTGKPVVLARTFVARVLGELLNH